MFFAVDLYFLMVVVVVHSSRIILVDEYIAISSSSSLPRKCVFFRIDFDERQHAKF